MDPRDLLRQKTLSNIKSTAQKLFNKGSQFIQENPSPAIYANKQFQSKVAQPFASGVKAAGRSYVEAIPAAIKLSPPAQLASAYQNYRTNVDPVQNLKTQGTNVLKSAPLVFGTAGAGNMARQGITSVAKNLLPNALIGGGISTATGGNFFEGAGRGVGATPQTSGVTGLTNPLINKTVGRLTQNIKSPLKNLIANRTATGLLNMPEGAVINSALGRKEYGLGEAAIDFGLGALGGSRTAGNAKAFDWGRNSSSRWHPEDVIELDGVTDFIRRTKNLDANQIKEADTILTSLARGYLPKSKIEKIASDYGRNSVGFLKAVANELHKSLNKQENTGKIKVGIVGDYKNSKTSEKVLLEARSSIKPTVQKTQSLKDSWKRFYTDNVNRFQPVENLVNQIEKKLGTKIETSKNPVIQIMRLMGAGGTAEQRHRKVLDPILKQIPKEQLVDFDVYLKARRDIGFGNIGRKVFGSDYNKAVEIKQALEAKYDGATWDAIAKQLYDYQDNNLKRLVEEGFIDESIFNAIRGQNPDYVPFQRVMDDVDNFIGLPTRRLSQGPSPVKKLEGSERDVLSPVESIIADTYKMEAAIAKNRVAKTIGQLSEILPDVNIKKVSNASQDTIPVWESGKKVYYEVPEDINKVVKGLNEEQQTQVVRLLSIPAQWLRQGATGRNIDFMIPNIIRDQFDAAINSKYGYIPFVDYFNGLAELVKYKMGKPSLYEDWANSGGKIFYEMAGGRKAIAKEISDATKRKNIGKKFLGAIVDGLEVMGEFSETPTRLGLYKKAFQKTGDTFLAAQESREGTLDFARMGAKMKTLNAIIPFFNVGIQGFDKLVRTVKSQPQKVLFYGALYGIAPQVALTVYNNTYFPEEYKEIADEVKQDNFVFVKGRNKDGRVNYVTLAKGNVLPYITGPVDNLLSAAAGYDRNTFQQVALSLLGDALPIVEPGRDINQALSRTVGGLIPQAFKPAVEDIANYKFYAGKQIVPEYMKNLSPVDQAYDFTETPYKYLGNVLQVSPLRVKNFLEATLAGGIKVPMQVFSIAQKVSRGEQPSPNEIPVLRRFFSETYDTGEQFQKKQKKEQKTLANKEEAKKSIAPLQKRLFGEVSAATEQEPMPKPKTELQAIVQQSSKDSKALREYKEYLTGEKNLANPQDYFKENYGTTPEELDLKIVKSLNTVEQAEQVYQLMKKDLTEEKFAKYVKDGLLTDAVAKQFLETEKITKEQHKILKTLMDQVKTGKKAVAKVSKAKKKKLSKIKKIKFKITPIKIKAPKVKLYKPTQIKIKPLTYKKEWMSKFGLL